MSRTSTVREDDRAAFAEVIAQAAIEPAPSANGSVDGRHARSERSRQAMVDALLDLLREGNLRPSSAQIAERAGVTQRTLFNQFGDMESLVNAVAARQVQRFADLLPRAGSGDLEDRVASYCGGLEHLLEETMHVRWAVVSNPNLTLTGARVARGAAEFMRGQLQEAFSEELSRLPEEEQDILLDMLELETDPIVWRLRRTQQELSPDEARVVLERSMLAALRDAQRRASTLDAEPLIG
jgi:AcrR family transcriptional regulator